MKQNIFMQDLNEEVEKGSSTMQWFYFKAIL